MSQVSLGTFVQACEARKGLDEAEDIETEFRLRQLDIQSRRHQQRYQERCWHSQ